MANNELQIEEKTLLLPVRDKTRNNLKHSKTVSCETWQHTWCNVLGMVFWNDTKLITELTESYGGANWEISCMMVIAKERVPESNWQLLKSESNSLVIRNTSSNEFVCELKEETKAK